MFLLLLFSGILAEDMALKYPIKFEELNQINGVGEGKAKRYGSKFIELIKNTLMKTKLHVPMI